MFPTRRATMGGDVFRDEFSLAFDGTDDFIKIPQQTHALASSNFSYVFWVKRNVTNAAHNILGHTASGSKHIRFSSDGFLQIETNTSGDLATGVLSINDTNWHHYAVVVGGGNGTVSMYQDGVSISVTSPDIGDSFSFKRIGQQGDGRFFNGNISEIAIYNKALSASEVKTIYNGREPYNHKEGVCSSNLQAWWRMGDGVLDTQPSNHTNSLLISDNTNATKGINLWTETYSSNTGSWSADGTNSLTQENNAIKITGDGSDSDGARIKLRATNDLSSNLTVGKLYELTFKSKVSSGSSVNVQFQISNAHSFVNFVNYTTEYKKFRHYFIATDATEAEIKCSAMGDGEIIFMKDFSVREINGNSGVGESFDGSNIVGDTP
tara:strand:- start:7158 stop:8294 length:1137 start_codon:yes stop_codon:yes gene_type:complete